MKKLLFIGQVAALFLFTLPSLLMAQYVVDPQISALPSSDTDRVVVFDSSQSLCYEMVSGVKNDRVCTSVLNFGGLGGIVGGDGHDIIVYQYDEAGDYTVNLTMEEQSSGTVATYSSTLTAKIVEVPLPALNFSSGIFNTTVSLKIEDLDLTDAEVASVIAFWGDRNRDEYSFPLQEPITHTYTRTGTEYHIRVKALFSDGGEFNYTFQADENLKVNIPNASDISECRSARGYWYNGNCKSGQNFLMQSARELISQSLEESGIVDHYIEMDSENIKIHFKAPPVKTDVDVLLEWTYIWASAAIQSTQSTITIVQYVEDTAVIQVTATTENIMKLISKELSFPDFADTTETSFPTTKWMCSSGAILIDGICY